MVCFALRTKSLLLAAVAVSELSGCFECPAALAEEDESLLAVDDTMFAAVDGRRGSPSITRKRPLPMLASIMAVGSLRET